MSLKINSVFKQTEDSVAIVVQVTNSLQNTLGKLEKLYQLIKTILDENETQQQSFQRVNSNMESFGTIAQNNQQKVQEVTKLSQTIAVSSENLKNLMYTLSRSL